MEIYNLDKNKKSSKDSPIPSPPFTAYFCAKKKSGKTVLLVNCLIRKEMLKDKFHQVYVCSPTSKIDEKWDLVRNQTITIPNKPLINLMKKIHKKKQKLLQMPDDDIDTDENPLPVEFIEDIDMKFLSDLMYENKFIIENYGKKFANQILVIFDDCIKSKIFNSKAFMDLIFKSRHFCLSFIIISQDYFSEPKALRNNNTWVCLWDSGNKKEIQKMYEENNNGLSWDEFWKVWNYIMDEDYAFLNINYNNSKKNRLWNSFKECIS